MISDILGFHNGRVFACDDSDNLYYGSPDLVPELADDHYRKLDAAAWAKQCCIAATLRPEDWRWEEFRPSNHHLFRASLKQYARERHGWPVWSRRNVNDCAQILGS